MFGLMGLDYGWGFDEIIGNPDAMEDSSIFQSGNNFNLYICDPKNLYYEKNTFNFSS